METKICTTIEQSERLIKLGLDKSTADMHYFSDGYNPTRLDVGFDKSSAKFYRGTENKYIPAWSLNALLESTPKYFFKSNHLFAQTIKYNCNDGLYHFFYRDYQYSGISKTAACSEDLLDGAFKMVVWLIENGYIKTNK